MSPLTLLFALASLVGLALIWVLRDPSPAPGRCRACGYPRQGLPHHAPCPECGIPHVSGALPPNRGFSWRIAADWCIGVAGALALLMLADPIATGYKAVLRSYPPARHIHVGAYSRGCHGPGFAYDFLVPLILFCLAIPAINLIRDRTRATHVFIAALLSAVALSFLLPVLA